MRIARLTVVRASLALLAVVASSSCSKDSGPTQPTRTTVPLTAASTSLRPLQQTSLTFPSSAGAAGTTLTGDLGGKAVKVVLSDSTHGDFLVPELGAGSYTLRVDFGASFRGTLSMVVQAAPVISDAKAVVTSTAAPVLATADSLVAAVRAAPAGSLGLSASEADYLAAKATELKSNIAKASSEDLKTFAAFLAANPDIMPAPAARAASEMATSPLLQPAVVSAADVSARVDAFILAFAARKSQIVKTIAGCTAGVALTGWTGGAALLVGGACAIAIGVQTAELVKVMNTELSNILAVPTDLQASETPVALQASEASDASSSVEGLAPVGRRVAGIAVEPNLPTKVYLRGTMRSFTNADRGLVGGLFSLVDEVTAAIDGVVKYLPNWARPTLSVPAVAKSAPFTPDATKDVVIGVQGCFATPEGNAFVLDCRIANTQDVTSTMTFSYKNKYGQASTTMPLTVKKTWGAAGTPQVSQAGFNPPTALGTGFIVSCYFNMVIPVSGNSPVTFTRWDGTWSNGHTEGGNTDFTVDPRKYDGVQWWNRQLVSATGPYTDNFTVAYTVQYRVAATGQTGSVQTTVRCP